MSQLAYKIRALISDRKALQDTVAVCDDFQPIKQKTSLKQHLQNATKESNPLLGNPAHPKLLLDECEQLIIPMQFAEHGAIAVVKFVVTDDKRQAIIQYFQDSQADLNDEHLVPLVAFFTENGYEVEYQCISENLPKAGMDPFKLLSYKAIDLVNQNADLTENLSATLFAAADGEEAVEEVEQQEQLTRHRSNRWRYAILAAMLVTTLVYSGWNYLQPYIAFLSPYVSLFSHFTQSQTLGLAALLPANPLLAIIACAAVFCAGWLLVSAFRYLTRPSDNEAPKASPATNLLRADPIQQDRNKTLLHSYEIQRQMALEQNSNELLGETKKKRPQP